MRAQLALQEAPGGIACEQIEQLHDLLQPQLLRRVKRDVLPDLPPIREQIVRVELSATQKEAYKGILLKEFPTLANGGNGGGGGVDPMHNVLMELRKCSNHTVLLAEKCKHEAAAMTLDELVSGSGKLELLDRMMPIFVSEVRAIPLCRSGRGHSISRARDALHLPASAFDKLSVHDVDSYVPAATPARNSNMCFCRGTACWF
jgi:SNF2-related domain